MKEHLHKEAKMFLDQKIFAHLRYNYVRMLLTYKSHTTYVGDRLTVGLQSVNYELYYWFNSDISTCVHDSYYHVFDISQF